MSQRAVRPEIAVCTRSTEPRGFELEAAYHPRQKERLKALYSYEILDTDREGEFDDIVKLVAALCGTAIAVVNLIDAERQWFKAEVGLGVRETPLATSICSHVILEDEFVEINDTLTDPRMCDNPLVCGDPGLRFYAGALLKSDMGLPIGTLCVLDWEPRELTPLQRDAIRVLARQVMAQLDLRRSLRYADTLRQEIDHRVKNSLQLLSSFTGLEGRRFGDGPEADVIEAIQGRIQAVALLHDQLYRIEAGAQIDLARYLTEIADHLREMAPVGVTLTVRTDPAFVGSRQAAQVGTLVNEVVSNAFKHGFPDDRGGDVTLTLGTTDGGLIRLECRDTGVGLAERVEGQPDGDSTTSGLGMQIAAALTRQLGCTLQLVPAPDGRGTIASLSFLPAS